MKYHTAHTKALKYMYNCTHAPFRQIYACVLEVLNISRMPPCTVSEMDGLQKSHYLVLFFFHAKLDTLLTHAIFVWRDLIGCATCVFTSFAGSFPWAKDASVSLPWSSTDDAWASFLWGKTWGLPWDQWEKQKSTCSVVWEYLRQLWVEVDTVYANEGV